MNIGEASAASGVSAKMIRYYEQIDLIPAAARTEAGYRLYSDQNVATLRFIRRARDLGFSVEEMGALLALWRDKNRASAEVKRIADDHVADIERRIRELESMAKTLRHLASHCHGDERPDCPILDDFADGAAPPEPAAKPSRRAGFRR
ncbi:Cu(I)-responsive transcriptional regulator [Kaistia algarum]|uniref:Cu(I)-responsive transcriptional regulator n=1 Tax=Kaistia algarum TaxID=2083279 RepID=UPI000CE92269|nr:Cu(I)-responsive transcriptional regulator [Kaistia algarum]MCX5515868.1 Cu(I)-responsive transcriptional regulator [Kaistia algarum]PPE80766.1 Cu(I)-responsive transcriptional regulator [Kaistia algarum]